MLIMKVLTEKNKVSYEYHSTQIDLLEQKYILEYCNEMIPDENIYVEENDDSYGREDEPHVTILYGLEEEVTPDKIQNIIYGKEFESFVIEFGNISSFRVEDKPYDVLKIDIISPELEKLHYLLRENLPNQNTFPEYHPHFTIAYIKKDTCKGLEKDFPYFTGKKFVVNEFMFSHLAGYKVPIFLY